MSWPTILPLLAMGLLACSGSEDPAAPVDVPVPKADAPTPVGALDCTPWPAPSNPPPLLDRPVEQRVSSQLQLLGLEGACETADAGHGTTSATCAYAGRGLHVQGQLLYNPVQAGRVHQGSVDRGPWRTWITTHENWGGYLDVTELSCAESWRDRLAAAGSQDLTRIEEVFASEGWSAQCEGLDPEGRARCTLSSADGVLQGELRYVSRPEGAAPVADQRSSEKGEARWAGPEGVLAITVGSSAGTQAVRAAVFPDAPLPDDPEPDEAADADGSDAADAADAAEGAEATEEATSP